VSLPARQTHTSLGSAFGSPEPQQSDCGFSGSLDPHKLGPNAWLSLEMVGLAVHQTYVCLGSMLGSA